MKSIYILVLLIVLFLTAAYVSDAQTYGQKKSVMVSASVTASPPSITLNWEAISGANSFNIYRKNKNSVSWGTAYVSGLAGNTVSWTDTNVSAGIGYEYKIYETGTYANGYIYSGIDLPENYYNGVILLVYDTVSTVALDYEINRWIDDVEGDGWDVIKIAVDRDDSVVDVKSRISSYYFNDPQNVKAAFLLGRVPVAYSGEIVPDGHTPDHEGAWPADGYYAELTSSWTDTYVNNSGATQARNDNIPGDGKFDQSYFPSDLELQIGRIDFINLPAFPDGENILLKKYLDKNHAYRNKEFPTVNRALIDDNFTSYSEGFSASGWRNFSVLCGESNIVNADYFTTMKSNDYQWSYGCGAGSYNSVSGIGGTTSFAADSLRSIFTMLFGSYFGDWDSPSNNVLRAAVASGKTLTNCWSGRPFWYFHHMGLGDNIGYSTICSMNNSSTYDANYGARSVHMALIGDPTLRAHIVAPVSNVVAAYTNGTAVISWTASVDTVAGYHIFRKNDTADVFQKINGPVITDTSYIDSCLIYPGVYTYMVRAVKYEHTYSGTYFNMSTGKADTLYHYFYKPVIADFSYILNGNLLSVNNNSLNAINYLWNFGDGDTSTSAEPVHYYSSGSVYTITLIASSSCGADTISETININTGEQYAGNLNNSIKVFPNPVKDYLLVENGNLELFSAQIFNIQGQCIKYSIIDKRIDVTDLPGGVYIIKFVNASGSDIYCKFVKMD